jgi:hypothetical protein
MELERDLYLAERVAEENEARVAAGEPPLQPDIDVARFVELREEAEREFAPRYAELDQDERSPFGAAPVSPPVLPDLALAQAIEDWQDMEDQRRAAAASRRETESTESGGLFEDEPLEGGIRNEAESGRPEVTANDMDLPDVVRRSWELTRIELRHELLIDRERRGWLTDFR